jgi:hypothetical protein
VNIFALTSNPAARILRFPLSNDLQNEISDVLRAQKHAFLDGIMATIEFDGRYRPDEGELLLIKNFVDPDTLSDTVKNPIGVEQFDPRAHSLETVKAIFAGCPDGSDQILIQLFEQRRLLTTKNVAIFFTGNTFERMSDSGLTLDSKLLAILEGRELRFQSFHFLRRVFNVDDYFKEATAIDVKSFATHTSLTTADPGTFEATTSSTMRRKIAMILQSGVLDKHSVPTILAAAKPFKVNIQTSPTGQIVLPDNPSELLKLLRFLDEDYYESPLSQTQYVSNSKRVAD